jgi:hypothetical protein
MMKTEYTKQNTEFRSQEPVEKQKAEDRRFTRLRRAGDRTQGLEAG